MGSEIEETKSLITALMTSSIYRCTIQQLCNDFAKTVGYPIPLRKLGFTNAESFLRSIPDTVRVYGNGPGAEVQAVVKAKSAHINELVAKQRHNSKPKSKTKKKIKNFSIQASSTSVTKNRASTSRPPIFEDEFKSKIPNNIQNNLRRLIMRFPDGISCSKLPIEYCKLFNSNISYEKYGFRSLIAMISDLPDIFYYTRTSSADFAIYDKQALIPSQNQNEISANVFGNDKDKDTEVPEIDWSLGSALIPSDIVPLGAVIPRYFPNDVKVGDYLDIKMGEIYSLNYFWINFPEGLEKLETELQTYFQTERNRYVIRDIFLEECLYCSVFHKGKYYRGVISDLLLNNPFYTKVLFIDYGSTGEIPTDQIYYLPKQFGKLPCQAVEGRLSCIIPEQDQMQSLHKFRQLVNRRELVAEIMKVDKKNFILDIYLADITNADNIFYINEKLVEGGYARFCE